MPCSPCSTHSRRAITGVLLLWLCVVVATVWAPLARAQLAAHSMERVCSGHGAVQWAPSPVSQDAHRDAAGLHHLVDCPLCLPVLAPPPGVPMTALLVLVQSAPQGTHAVHACAESLHWPPARGPPTAIFLG